MKYSKEGALKIIADHPCASMITVDENNFPVERVMYTAKVDDDLTVYYGTFRSSNKCAQLSANPGIILIWPAGAGFLTLKGKAEVLDDAETLNHVWQDLFSQHFTGPTDPTFVAVKIKPVSVTYYQEGMLETQSVDL
jgi:general stress protein 26